MQVESLVAPTEEDVGDEEEIEIKDEGEMEVENLKHAVDPGQPTSKQIEEHRKTHLPYRLWCKWCILGRGRGLQHRKSPSSRIPIIGLDYFFITAGGVKKREELNFEQNTEGEKELEDARAKGEIVKCLMIRCSISKIMLGFVVPRKGPDENDFVADAVASAVAWLGYTKIILKADGEPAIQALVKRVLELVKIDCKDLEQASKEDPAAYDSQSNGGIEQAIRTLRGVFRTLKLCLEERFDKTIPVDHPVVHWLLEHACLLLNVMVRGDDGLTAWARIRGRAFVQQLIGFGERVLYKFPSKGPQHAPYGNMGAVGGEGVFLGYSRQSNTFIVATESGITTARSVTRRPERDRWSADALARIQQTPMALHARQERTRVRFDQPAQAQGPTADEVRPAQARRLRINKTDLEQFGYEESCAQCKHILRYGKAKPGGTHSEQCRTRIIEAMSKTDTGKARLAEQEERENRSIAEQIEHADQHAPAASDAAAAPAPRGFLERNEDRQHVGARPPPEARRNEDRQHVGARPPLEARVREADERQRVVRFQEEAESGWLPVPGGEAAPVTPRGTPQVVDDREENTIEDIFGDGGVATEAHDEAMEADAAAEGYDVEMDFVGNIESHDHLGSVEPSTDDFISGLLLAQLGSIGRRYKREARKTAKVLVSEIYSPPRVTKLLRQVRSRHVLPGFAFDITVNDPQDGQPWDFSIPAKRERARRLLREQGPYVLIGSPMCTHYCSWQALNYAKSNDKVRIERERAAAEEHMNFVASLYEDQLDAGRYFLHEHPLGATSWKLPKLQAVLERAEVQRVRGDQCQFGSQIHEGEFRGDPILKPTGFMTNSPAIAEALAVRCQGHGGACSRPQGGTHRLCSGKHAKYAAIYPKRLCRAIIKGVRDQMRRDGQLKDGCFGVQAPDEDAEVERNLRGPEQGYSGRFRDDLTGQVLKDVLVKEARAKELDYFHAKGVWLKVPKLSVRQKGGRPPISVRWVDVNKGDDLTPKYRSRLVARQIKALDSSGTSYFAPAPPLEALRVVLSMAMTRVGDWQPVWDPHSEDRIQLSLVDVKRAYFNAQIDPRDPPTHVQLPEEDPDSRDMCAQLLRHMYGTRPAADGWQEEYSTLLVSLGFKQGDACPNVFRHAQRQIVMSVHGDDFTSCGPKPSLDWLEAAIQEHYELDVGPRLGPGPQDAKEGRVLNRVIRWGDRRLEYEADPRQIERLVAECGLEGAKAVATPGVKPTFQKLEEDKELPAHLVTAFRGAAARGNYLAADRIDVQFACKEVCRWMAKPTAHAWEALKRVCRYLCRAPRLVYEYRQQSVSAVDVYTDTDWAGCPKTRKSTSGGCVMLGHHACKHWSSTQQSISLSSGEAEFAGVIRGAGQGLGFQALLRDLGLEIPLRVWTDSSAAIGICSRQGLGKLRHLDTHTLWIQQAVRSKRVDLRKVPGEQNPADLLTKHSISRQRLEDLVSLYGCRYLGGRAESAPQVRKGETNRTTMADAGGSLVAAAEDKEEEEAEAETSALMPHRDLNDEALDAQYPPLVAPEDEALDDLQDDGEDATLQHGLRVAREIQRQTEAQGRRRRPEGGDTKEELNVLEDVPLVSASRSSRTSTAPRRRSVWDSHPEHYQQHTEALSCALESRIHFDFLSCYVGKDIQGRISRLGSSGTLATKGPAGPLGPRVPLVGDPKGPESHSKPSIGFGAQ